MMSKKQMPKMGGGQPFLVPKSKAERDKQELLESFVTRKEMIENIAQPLSQVIDTQNTNISAVVQIMIEKGLFTEEEFIEKCKKIVDDVMEKVEQEEE